MKNNKSSENCGRCGKNARIEGAEHCKQCLCEIIEKRVKKELAGARSNSNRGYYRLAVVCDNKSSLTCVAAAYIIKKVCNKVSRHGFGVEIITSESTSQLQENGTVVLPKCADDIATGFMEKFISPKISPKPSQQPALQQLLKQTNLANIFEAVTEKELMLYAGIKSLKYAKTKGRAKESDLKQKIQKLQARYPGIIEALARSGKRIEVFVRNKLRNKQE